MPRRHQAAAFGDEPVEIDGMQVLFDKPVTLFPVTLLELPGATPPAAPARSASRR
jgi:hypothetical protein